jgi:peptide subunit release factor RF-3
MDAHAVRGVDARLEPLEYTLARWIDEPRSQQPMRLARPDGRAYRDRTGRLTVLFASRWDLEYFESQNPDVAIRSII